MKQSKLKLSVKFHSISRINELYMFPVQYIKDPLFQEWMYGLLVTLMIGLDLQLTLTQRSKVNDRMFVIGVFM